MLEANGWKVPATGAELVAALAKLGDFVQLPVTFSAVALHSGLSHPRVVITMRPSSQPGMVTQFSGGFGWGGGGGQAKLVAGTPTPLGATPANKPSLEGRLFLAANTEPNDHGRPVVKTVEFISWNGHRQKFDFGVIEGMGGGKPELKVLDGTRCFSCHKNRGPIMGVAPWSNTAHNDLVRATAAPLLRFPNRLNQDGKEDSSLGPRTDIDGLALLTPNGPEVDAAVRQGADVLRDRERFKLLARTPEGRKAFVMLLGAIAARGPLDKLDQKLKLDLNAIDLVPFLRDAHAANKALAPSALADFSPAGPVTKAVLVRTPAGPANQVARYDALCAAGQHGLPSEHQPSNPKAFVRPPVPVPTHPSQLVSAVVLARAIGLSEDDRAWLAGFADIASRRFDTPPLTPAAVASAIFTGPAFTDVVETGALPERDDFKDRFVTGISAVLRSRKSDGGIPTARERYTSAPPVNPLAGEEQETAVLPSHACLACHDVRGAGKVAFNPIPALAFDPFDATARDAWLKSADRKKKAEVLARLVKRLGTDKDMPPEDSTEHALYRVKDPAALNAVREWLDAELKKVK